MMEHTKEPWLADANYVITQGETKIAYCNHIDPYDGIGYENARRIVACVNACAGLDTELLENIVLLGDTLKSRFETLKVEAGYEQL